MSLPPLNALRAFEADARLGSFVRASEELHVTAGAISRHIKLLEAHLGTKLFDRRAQGVRITEDGSRLLPILTRVFDDIEQALNEFDRSPMKLAIIASPTFANRRLIPKLNKFAAEYSNLDISVRTIVHDVAELATDKQDCGIVTTHSRDWPTGFRATHIFSEELTPVCSPDLVHTVEDSIEPNLLAELPMLSITNCPEDWPRWLSANSIDLNLQIGSPSFETAELAIRAAIEGMGVFVMDRYLIQSELEQGSLIDMFPHSQPVNHGYFFVCKSSRWKEPVITAFREWLTATFANVNNCP